MPKSQRPWLSLEERRLIELRSTKPPTKLKDIGKELGRSIPSLRCKLKMLGMANCVNPQRPRGELMKLVKRYWKPGRTDVEIADIIGASPANVQQARYRLGLPMGITPKERGQIAIRFRWAYYRARTDPDYDDPRSDRALRSGSHAKERVRARV